MISIAIFEDNSIHQERLCCAIHSYLKEAHEIDIYKTDQEFMELREQSSKPLTYQIFFMDIELGEESGIEFAEKINRLYPDAQIIYISQYLKYVSSVYESRHIYFIYKNDMDKYLPRALEIALNNIKKTQEYFLEFSWNKELYKIRQHSILYIERVLRVSEIHTDSGDIFCTSEKLTDIIKRLNDSFTICHRSYLVNLNAITKMDKTYLYLDDNIRIPVSRSNYPEVKRKYYLLMTELNSI